MCSLMTRSSAAQSHSRQAAYAKKLQRSTRDGPSTSVDTLLEALPGGFPGPVGPCNVSRARWSTPPL
eukprot:4724825-Amphidinium_carterae.1